MSADLLGWTVEQAAAAGPDFLAEWERQAAAEAAALVSQLGRIPVDPAPNPPKKKRKASRSPTERSLERLRREGWRAAVVERHVSFQGGARGRGFKRDLFGFIDVLAYRVHVPAGERRKPPGEDFGDIGLLAVQATSGPHVAARVEKILGASQEETDKGRAAAAEVRAAALDWLVAGGRIEVHGWRKSARTKRYELRVVPVTLADFDQEASR